MTNREILNASSELLSELDRQRQHVLRLELLPIPCPACGRGLNYLEATRVDIDNYDFGVSQYECVCPCGAELEQIIPAFPGGGHGWHWQLRPSWLHAQLEKARAYDLRKKEGEEQ